MKQSSIIYTAPKVVVEAWKVPDVVHRGKTGTYKVIGDMIPAMTQDEQAQKYGTAFASMSLVWAIASRAYDLRNKDSKTAETAEGLRKFLQKGMGIFPNTSTRLVHDPEGIDKIMDNYGTDRQYSLEGNLIGSEGLIQDISDEKKFLKLLLGTGAVQKVNRVSHWLNETNVFLYRQSRKPEERLERVARFDAYSGRLGLDLGRGPSIVRGAFRVERVE